MLQKAKIHIKIYMNRIQITIYINLTTNMHKLLTDKKIH